MGDGNSQWGGSIRSLWEYATSEFTQLELVVAVNYLIQKPHLFELQLVELVVRTAGFADDVRPEDLDRVPMFPDDFKRPMPECPSGPRVRSLFQARLARALTTVAVAPEFLRVAASLRAMCGAPNQMVAQVAISYTDSIIGAIAVQETMMEKTIAVLHRVPDHGLFAYGQEVPVREACERLPD